MWWIETRSRANRLASENIPQLLTNVSMTDCWLLPSWLCSLRNRRMSPSYAESTAAIVCDSMHSTNPIPIEHR